ncbi:Cytochrome P450 monooxygenase FUS8 [Colletotrichum sp. SAR 10_70]|nr:Cytochrome P450 monooxygenase FUS8 [Colletotrichum sp. SAR 10_71]KAI8174806.1 Cytochrome P450 monooxygenase FUS8 [Colletotrichum sp. SAR 10_70]KAI8185319.1 Cytochrome P450 monooxygenase FUS8 [Colletotrichum sp. SAR 10_75]KAI8195079.1 Cytochrome P450 monooxygenase FUS8 [Colletotrichum sp. SAR 10_65]KAI8211000.1 Cytochrome P450 monooxygenase FUS8 [Colletotrichum sp. SAR 10_76]KAI8251870.1 Cytochrome P450 monooxygenase FUS8 [Colletotrichum sp. SAR 10_77]KAJ5003906.1 Cytochrome P450 monooxygen
MASAYMIAIYFAVVIFAGIQIKHKINNYKSPLRKVPGPCHKKYGGIVRLGPRQVWISDKEAMKTILVKTDLPKVAMYAEISRDKFSPGLFGEIRPEPHKRLKRFLSPAFTVNYIDNLEMFFKTTVRDLLNKYQTQINADPVYYAKKGIEVDLMDDLHNVALDIMGECSFGKGFGQTNPDSMIEDGVDERIWKSIPRSIFDGLSKRYQTVYVKKFFRSFGIDIQFDWPAEMITAIDAVVQRRKRTHDIERRDLLQHLIEEGKKPDTGTTMNARDIVDQMAEILLAGSETTSGTIGCLFLELARNPDVRAKLFASLPSKGFNDEIVTSKAVRSEPEYEYLEACIKENLRLHPIASEMGRRTGNQWVNLCGYDLPPHTVVSASYRDLHRNEEFWPQAERFWPERWLAEDKREGAPAPDMDAYYPFSGGKHSCIGINFAWAEMRMVAANLLQRFDVLEVPGQDIDFRQYITMQFATGHWKVVLKPRN